MSENTAPEPKKRRQPEQQAPPVQRLRVRYAKRGPARFTSHRDVGRALERALRRAEIPMAYSSGFSPHPRISYANASPTSAATEAEYLELGLSEVCDPDKVAAALNEVLGPGLDVLEVVEAGKESFNDLLVASAWLIDLGEVDQATLARAVDALLASESVTVKRMTKSGMREFDVRAALVELRVESATGQLFFIGRHEAPLVRPDDVVQALRQLEPGLGSARPALLTRLAQGRLPVPAAQGVLVDPFSDTPVAVR
ncbi:TIGR03936 family radical SAM-associated protein [Propionibacteriaceae bacterium G1746]|uniref:TIGR03936 family radical SAM-associated protein n=1 Tax=Aestuariimicrobium sp. G57 TaxID=3418485 RepID=UPI003C208D02